MVRSKLKRKVESVLEYGDLKTKRQKRVMNFCQPLQIGRIEVTRRGIGVYYDSDKGLIFLKEKRKKENRSFVQKDNTKRTTEK